MDVAEVYEFNDRQIKQRQYYDISYDTDAEYHGADYCDLHLIQLEVQLM